MKTAKYFSATTTINPFDSSVNPVSLELTYDIPEEKYTGVSLVSMEFEPFRDSLLDPARTVIEVREVDGAMLAALTPKAVKFGLANAPNVDEALWFDDMENARSEIWVNSGWAGKKFYINSYFRNAVLSSKRLDEVVEDLYNLKNTLIKETEFNAGEYEFVPETKTRKLVVLVYGAGGGGGGSGGNAETGDLGVDASGGKGGLAGNPTNLFDILFGFGGGGGGGGIGGNGFGNERNRNGTNGQMGNYGGGGGAGNGAGTGKNGEVGAGGASPYNAGGKGGLVPLPSNVQQGGNGGNGGGGGTHIFTIPLSVIKSNKIIVGRGGAGGAGGRGGGRGANGQAGGTGADGKVYIYEYQY